MLATPKFRYAECRQLARDEVAAGSSFAVAGLLSAFGSYVVGRDIWATTLVGSAIAIILFVMLGFPAVANRPIWGRVRTPGEQVRRAARRLLVVGLLIIVLGFIFDSLALIAFALAFWIVWFVFLGAATGRWGGQRRT